MYKFLIGLACMMLLSSCGLLHIQRVEVEQGNVITENKVHQLRIGMSVDQVKNIMGMPMLSNIFSLNRIDYVYTLRDGFGNLTEKRVICVFYQGRLKNILTS